MPVQAPEIRQNRNPGRDRVVVPELSFGQECCLFIRLELQDEGLRRSQVLIAAGDFVGLDQGVGYDKSCQG